MKAPKCRVCGQEHWGLEHVGEGWWPEGSARKQEPVRKQAPVSNAGSQRRWRAKSAEQSRERQRERMQKSGSVTAPVKGAIEKEPLSSVMEPLSSVTESLGSVTAEPVSNAVSNAGKAVSNAGVSNADRQKRWREKHPGEWREYMKQYRERSKGEAQEGSP